MRAILAGLLLVSLAPPAALGQDVQRKPVPIKADLSFFENSWGLRPKAFTLELLQVKTKDGEPLLIGRITYVLEFDKDVINQDLDDLINLLMPRNKRLRHTFLDHDQIAVNPFMVLPYRIQGEISGVRGEAFRMVVDIEYDAEPMLLSAKKLVVRP